MLAGVSGMGSGIRRIAGRPRLPEVAGAFLVGTDFSFQEWRKVVSAFETATEHYLQVMLNGQTLHIT